MLPGNVFTPAAGGPSAAPHISIPSGTHHSHQDFSSGCIAQASPLLGSCEPTHPPQPLSSGPLSPLLVPVAACYLGFGVSPILTESQHGYHEEAEALERVSANRRQAISPRGKQPKVLTRGSQVSDAFCLGVLHGVVFSLLSFYL